MFMEEVFTLTPFTASLSTTLFWSGIALSRLIGSRISTHKNARTLIRWGALFGGLALTMAVFSHLPALTMAGFLLTGLLTGATIPMLIHIATLANPGHASQVTGILYMFTMTACIVFPWMCGFTADRWGFRAGISISAAALFAVMILSFALRDTSD